MILPAHGWIPLLFNLLSMLAAIAFLHSISRSLASQLINSLPLATTADHCLIYAVVFSSSLVVGFHALGVLSLITGLPLVHSVPLTILFAIVRAIIARTPPPRGERYESELSWRSIRESVRKEWAIYSPLVKVIAFAGAAGAGGFFADALTHPPSGWDASVYHLPLAVKWMQSGSLAFLEESWKFQMPSNGELMLLFSLFSGTDRGASLASLPFGLLAALTVYRIAFRLTTSHNGAMLAFTGFAATPVVLYNSFEANIADMFGAAYFLISAYFLSLYDDISPDAKHPPPHLVTLAGLAFGLCIGARYMYVPLLPYMLAICVGVHLQHHGRLHWSVSGWTRAALATGRFLCFTAIPAVFWYGRNLLHTGNPLHPLHFALDPTGLHVITRSLRERQDVFPPLAPRDLACIVPNISSNIDWLVAPWKDCWYTGDPFSINWGLGPLFATIVPTIAVLGFGLSLFQGWRERRMPPTLFWLLTLAVFLIYWWEILFRVLRFLLPALALTFVFAAVGLKAFSARAQRVIELLVLVAVLLQTLLVSITPLQFIASRSRHHEWSRAEYYGIPAIIDTLPTTSVILNASDELKNYGLFGSDRQHSVITDRSLLEPSTTLVIDQPFVDRWKLTHIFIDTSQHWTIGGDVHCLTIHEREIELFGRMTTERLCRIDRS